MIRPVDMQVIIPKSQEVAQIQQTENNRADVAQHHFASQFEKEVQMEQRSVVQSKKSEGRSVDKDAQKKNPRDGKNKKKKDSSKQEEKSKKSIGTSMFDMKI